MKKYLFIAWVLGIVALAWSRLGWAAGLLALALFAWLLHETRQRMRPRFLARWHKAETVLTVSPSLHLGCGQPLTPHALLVEHGPQLILAAFPGGAIEWRRGFDAAPQAVLCGDSGNRLYYATDDALVRPTHSWGRDAPLA